MGDPIEAGAISDVFTPYRSSEDPMYVGAEHLEGAAGITISHTYEPQPKFNEARGSPR
jgi:hypothetical protein